MKADDRIIAKVTQAYKPVRIHLETTGYQRKTPHWLVDIATPNTPLGFLWPLSGHNLQLSAVNCAENQKVWCKPETSKKKNMKLVLTRHISKGENCYFCRWMVLFLSLLIGNCFYRHIFCANCRQQKQPASDQSNEEDLVQHPVSIQLHLATGSLQPLQ